MQVVLSTVSRFHTFDLARELDRRGILERVFTGQPRWNLRGEGVPVDRITTFPWLQVPWEVTQKVGRRWFPGKDTLNWYCHQTLDRYVAAHLPHCDIFHALSYCGLHSGRRAQELGASWVCDSLSWHWPHQEDLLRRVFLDLEIPYRSPPARFLDYALESYGGADLITAPSHHAARTYLHEGIPAERVVVVPYGVDLGRFAPVDVPPHRHFRILFVGQIGVRKGLDDLLQAFRLAAIPGAELQLVGPLLPDGRTVLARYSPAGITMIGPVAQARLAALFSGADLLVLPSLAEGLALVLGQAMACGCPVLATDATGAEDLLTNGREGWIVPARSPVQLAERLTWCFEHPTELHAMRSAARERVRALGGWQAYGEHMVSLFARLRCAHPGTSERAEAAP